VGDQYPDTNKKGLRGLPEEFASEVNVFFGGVATSEEYTKSVSIVCPALHNPEKQNIHSWGVTSQMEESLKKKSFKKSIAEYTDKYIPEV